MRPISRHSRRQAGFLAAQAVAVLCVAPAILLRAAVGPLIGPALPFSAFYPAVLVAMVVGGRRSGLTAFALGGASGWFLFASPAPDLTASNLAELASLAIFTVIAVMVLGWAKRRRGPRDAFRQTLLIGTTGRSEAVRLSRPANDTSGSPAKTG